jgi:hypothetical protein
MRLPRRLRDLLASPALAAQEAPDAMRLSSNRFAVLAVDLQPRLPQRDNETARGAKR